MTQPHLEKLFYLYVRQDNALMDQVESRFFTNGVLKEAFEIDKAWYNKYHQLPKPKNIVEEINKRGVKDVSQEELEIVFETDLADYDELWLEEETKTWIEIRNLYTTFFRGAEIVKNTVIDSTNVKDIINSVKDLFMNKCSLDLNFSSGLDFFDPRSHVENKSLTFTTGYPYLDSCMAGGWEKGALIIFMGPPKRGKSFTLCNLAASSVQLGYNVVYVTLEMSEQKIVKRIGSNLLDIPMDDYSEFAENTARMQEKLGGIQAQTLRAPGQFFVKQFPASTASVNDIENYVRKLQEVKGIGISLVVVDYLNIIKNWRNANTENTFMKLKQVCEDLRAMSTRNLWCTVSATQTNKEAYESSNITMANVSESRAIIETADAVFAIQQDMVMRMNNIMDLKAIALRNASGVNSHKNYITDFEYMRLTEDHNSTVQFD